MATWMEFVVLFAIIKRGSPFEEVLQDLLLTKSLGYSIRKLDSKTLEDAKLNKEFMHQYEEMLRASRESFENIPGNEDRRLRRVVGDLNYEMMKEGLLDHRRNSPSFEPPLGKRRAWTQALRRQKLKSQGQKSHHQHARQNTNRENRSN